MPWRRAVMALRPDVLHVQNTPQSHYDIIKEGPVSTVARTWIKIERGEPQWVVVKTATAYRKFAKEPHDILKELRILSALDHSNVIEVLGSFFDEQHLGDGALSMYMPWIPISLAEILASPYFSPHPFPPLHTFDAETRVLCEEKFTTLARSIMAQVLFAIAYLHNDERRIAHRDIKPENILLTRDGCVKLIDFGTCWSEIEDDKAKTWDLWPEYRKRLYFEVSTGAYRAPELLFGARDYDPLAIDLWSLGATFAEFFTALRLSSDEDDDEDEEAENKQEEELATLQPFVVPRYLRIGYPGTQWMRHTLYNGDRGEIGLAWSIFKIHGTPTEANWPDYCELPGAKSVVFNIVPEVPLDTFLPNLPPSTYPLQTPSSSSSSSSVSSFVISSETTPIAENPPPPRPTSPLDLLSRFLVYSPSKRLAAKLALYHKWFTEADALLLPPGVILDKQHAHLNELQTDRWRGRTLSEWLEDVLIKIPES